MTKIELTQGKFAFVDLEDIERVNKYKWFALKSGKLWYAIRQFKDETGRNRMQRLHRFIMNAEVGIIVDHIDGDGLNCCKENLRFATHAQNRSNHASLNLNNVSGYCGVSWKKDKNKWHAYLTKKGVKKFLGYFSTKEEAAKAYNEAALQEFGKYAKLNVIS